MHVYDADKISGNLKMRYAKENETCLTLDEENRECTKDMIVISDDKQLHGIGGVMGGLIVDAVLIQKMFFLKCFI